jgi:hypothetical protein
MDYNSMYSDARPLPSDGDYYESDDGSASEPPTTVRSF